MHTPTTSAEQGLRPHIATYIDAQASQHDQQESLQAIAGYVSGGVYTIKDLVRHTDLATYIHALMVLQQAPDSQIDCLGQLLVSEDDNDRGRAALLLGEVSCPELKSCQFLQQADSFCVKGQRCLQVVVMVPSLAQAQPIQQHLVQFLCSRLADWLVQAAMLLCSDASRARAASHRCVTGLGAGLQCVDA